MANRRSIKAEPAKSVVAAAVEGKVHPGRKAVPVTDATGVPVGSNVQIISGGGIATGAALAERVWDNAVNTDSSSWSRQFRELFNLNAEGHETFAKTIRKKRASLNAGEREQGFKTNLSRISEALVVNSAAANGCTLQQMVDAWNGRGIGKPVQATDLSKDYLVAYCRNFERERGAGDNRGRRAVSAAQRLVVYMLTTFKDQPKLMAKLAEACKIAADHVHVKGDVDKMIEAFKPAKDGEEAPELAPIAAQIVKLTPVRQPKAAEPPPAAAKKAGSPSKKAA